MVSRRFRTLCSALVVCAMTLPMAARADDSLGAAGYAASGNEADASFHGLSSRDFAMSGLHAMGKRPARKPSGPKFAGSWSLKLKKRSDNCPSSTAPSALNARINISSQLNGTDGADGSPFFQGRVSGTSITFGRSRSSTQCTQTQTLQILGVRGNLGTSKLLSQTQCGTFQCSTMYSGPASRR